MVSADGETQALLANRRPKSRTAYRNAAIGAFVVSAIIQLAVSITGFTQYSKLQSDWKLVTPILSGSIKDIPIFVEVAAELSVVGCVDALICAAACMLAHRSILMTSVVVQLLISLVLGGMIAYVWTLPDRVARETLETHGGPVGVAKFVVGASNVRTALDMTARGLVKAFWVSEWGVKLHRILVGSAVVECVVAVLSIIAAILGMRKE